jgi:hypothetical protein
MQLFFMAFNKNDLWSHKQIQSGLELHMQLIFATNVNLDENENEKTLISSIFSGITK